MGVALGTKVYSRTDDLRELLQTLPDDIFDSVYVADDDDSSPRKEAVYDEFDVHTIDLPYDAGPSAGRNAIVDAAEEEYLCIVDPDHRIPSNVLTLVDQLERCDELGGVGAYSSNRIRTAFATRDRILPSETVVRRSFGPRY